MAKKILLAEDSVTMQKVFELTFAAEDVSITAVPTAVEAIARAKEMKPDLVIADLSIIGKNGYDVCEELKADPKLADIPVLLLHGSAAEYDEDRARKMRADGDIAKPFETQAVIDKVKGLLASRRGAPALVSAHEPLGPVQSLAPLIQSTDVVIDTGDLSAPPAAAAAKSAGPFAPVAKPAAPAAAGHVKPAATPPKRPITAQGLPAVGAKPKPITAPGLPVLGPKPITASGLQAVKAPLPPKTPAPPFKPTAPAPKPVTGAVAPAFKATAPVKPAAAPPPAAAAPRTSPAPSAGKVASRPMSVDVEITIEAEPPQGEAEPLPSFDEVQPTPIYEPRRDRPLRPDATLAGMGGSLPPPPAGMPLPVSTQAPQSSPEAGVTPLPPLQPGEPYDPAAYEAIARLSREIIEKIVWEIVPDLAERIIREELDRLVESRRAK